VCRSSKQTVVPSRLNSDTEQCVNEWLTVVKKIYLYIIYIIHVHPYSPLYYIVLMRGIPWLTIMHFQARHADHIP